MRVLVALGSTLLVLAGCASPSTTDEPPQPTATYSVTADSLLPVAPVLTDTLHLLEAPHVAGTLPVGPVLERTVCARGLGVSIGGNPVLPECLAEPWTLPRPEGFATLVGSVLFWIDVQGTVTNSNPSDPCFWEVLLYAPAPADGSSAPVSVSEQERICAPEPPVVPTGIRALRFAVPARVLSDATATELRLDLYSYGGVLAPGASMKVLTGTPEYDSQVTLSGLQVPLSTQTYLSG